MPLTNKDIQLLRDPVPRDKWIGIGENGHLELTDMPLWPIDDGDFSVDGKLRMSPQAFRSMAIGQRVAFFYHGFCRQMVCIASSEDEVVFEDVPA